MIPKMLINMAAGYVSIQHSFRGPNHACSTACATGVHAIGDAYRMIQAGDAKLMVAGASESALDAVSFAGFSRAMALTRSHANEPFKASRPFDEKRDGFVMGEGAAVVILEEYEHAVKRGAPQLYAEVKGYGISGDAFHITTPSGKGAIKAMKRALETSGNNDPGSIDYINAHATSTPAGDKIEYQAIKEVFGKVNKSNSIKVSSTKGSIGHLLGAAGAIESVATILSVHSNKIPPTLNFEKLDDELIREDNENTPARRIDIVKETEDVTVNRAMKNAFGFGGTCASILFEKIKQ